VPQGSAGLVQYFAQWHGHPFEVRGQTLKILRWQGGKKMILVGRVVQ